MKKIVDIVDKRFVGRLYDYRSRLLHNKRAKHSFGGQTTVGDFNFHLRLIPSEISLKHFKLINDKTESNQKVTLTYLSSWLIKQTFIEIEAILDVLSVEIKKDSCFIRNLHFPKKGDNALLIVSVNPDTKYVEPMSDGLWKQYKDPSQQVR